MNDNGRQTRVALNRMVDALRVLRSYHPTIESQTAQLFLEIARVSEGDEGIHMKDLAESVGIAQSSASRSIALLSRWLKHGTEGLDWVKAEEDPMNRRLKTLKLTAKGERVKHEVARAIGGNR